MTTTELVTSPSHLEHALAPHFPTLRSFESSRSLKASHLYRGLSEEVERVMRSVVHESLAPSNPRQIGDRIRATAWNIERGIQLEGIIETLKSHKQIKESDLLLVTEVDHGMARTGNRNVAREIAQGLEMNYAFVPCYLSLVKGSGLEYQVQGENTTALHGNALFSRHPLRNVHRIALPNGKDLMRGKEKRLGWQQAVAATVDHPLGSFYAVSLHLDAHSSQRHRRQQMRLVLDHLDRLEPRMPILVGGDWNTSTFNSKSASYSILGYARRVLMGVRNVIENHYPYPDRWFERHLFRDLKKRGYRYEDLNEPGVCTLHYDVQDLATNTNMADWIPGWCFWFINWALKRAGGQCSMKLDWFAGRDLDPCSDPAPRVIGEIHDRDEPLSDHDPILLDFRLAGAGESPR